MAYNLTTMKTLNKTFLTDLKELPPKEKLKLAEFLLDELDTPNPIIEKEWAVESERRLKLYKAGKIKSYSLDEVFGK